MKILHRAGALALALFASLFVTQAAFAQASCTANPSVTGRPCVTMSNGSEYFDFRQGGQAVTAPRSFLAANALPNVSNRDPANFGRWRAKLAQMQLARLTGATPVHPRLLIVPDSKWFVGAGTSSDGTYKSVNAAQRSKTAYLAKFLNDKGYGTTTEIWCGSYGLTSITAINNFDPRQVINSDASFGATTIGGAAIGIPGTTARTVAPTSGVITNQVSILAYTRSAAGVAQVSDGTTSPTNSFVTATDGVARFEFTGFSRAAGKTYSITRSSGGTISPICVIASDSTVSQIEVLSGVIIGSTTNNWTNTTSTYGPLVAIAAYDPDLTIISLGTNDPSVMSVAQYTMQYQTILTTVKANGGGCVVEIESQPATSSANYASYATFAEAARKLAATNGCMIVDQGKRFVDWATANALGLEDDTVPHETTSGQADQAKAISDAIIF